MSSDIAKRTFEILDGFRERIGLSNQEMMRESTALANGPMIHAAVESDNQRAFAFALGCIVGQLLFQYKPETRKAFGAGCRAGREASRFIVKAGTN